MKYMKIADEWGKLLLGDGVMETHLSRGKSLVRFDSLPPKDISKKVFFGGVEHVWQ